jgi:hypothetical protein
MRLPVIDNRPDQVDIPAATEMLYYAIDNGVNYVDTAYVYHGSAPGGPGNSETFLGDALRGGLREKVMIATKLPSFIVRERADMDRILADQLQRLRTDRIDCYLLHGMNSQEWSKMLDLGVLDFLERAKAEGQIRFAGFSFHDEFPVLMSIVDAYGWDMCQIQYNYMDTDFQAGRAGLRYAAQKGLAVVVMEPVKGGRLVGKRVPEEVQAIWDESPEKRGPAEWALRFVWDHKEVSSVLSGMSTLKQVQENVRAADEGLAGSLGRLDLELIDRVKEVYEKRQFVPCTRCNYCMPCPNGLNIPTIFSCMNDSALYGSLEDGNGFYQWAVKFGGSARASDCEKCGDCEAACPQKIGIIDALAKCAEAFDDKEFLAPVKDEK